MELLIIILKHLIVIENLEQTNTRTHKLVDILNIIKQEF